MGDATAPAAPRGTTRPGFTRAERLPVAAARRRSTTACRNIRPGCAPIGTAQEEELLSEAPGYFPVARCHSAGGKSRPDNRAGRSHGMKIALDATPLTVASGGAKRYTEELSLGLANEFPDDEFWLLSDQSFDPPEG